MRDLYQGETPWSKKEREKNKKKFWITFGVLTAIFPILGIILLLFP